MKLFFIKNLWLTLKKISIFAPAANASVAELVDALDSKSSDSNIVWVRFPPEVLKTSYLSHLEKIKGFFICENLIFVSVFAVKIVYC